MEKKAGLSKEIEFLAALCLFMSAVEYAVPKPLPFLRLGLANLPVILSVGLLNPGQYFFLVLIKVLEQGFISGTFFSYIFVFSICGSFASAVAMFLMHRFFFDRGWISLFGLSICGALANNSAQILCARFLVFKENTVYIAPLLLITGLATGTAIGLVVMIVEKKSRWYKLFCGSGSINTFSTELNLEKMDCGQSVDKKQYWSGLVLFSTGIALMLSILLIRNLCILWILVLVSFIGAWVARAGKIKVLPSLLLTITLTFFELLTPNGKILFYVGKLPVTLGALEQGLQRSGVLVGMVFSSQMIVNKNISLKGFIGRSIQNIFLVFNLLRERSVPKKTKLSQVFSYVDESLVEIWNNLGVYA